LLADCAKAGEPTTTITATMAQTLCKAHLLAAPPFISRFDDRLLEKSAQRHAADPDTVDAKLLLQAREPIREVGRLILWRALDVEA